MSTTARDEARMLPRFAWLSALAAVVTIGLKTGAWALTGSVGLLSDAMESFVNLAGAILALAAPPLLRAQPAPAASRAERRWRPGRSCSKPHPARTTSCSVATWPRR